MSRGLTPEQRAAVESTQFNLALFAEFEFSAGTVNLWTGLGDIVTAGKTWAGVGTLGQVGDVEESSATKSGTVMCALSGCAPEVTAAIMTGVNRGRIARVWWAPMNATFTAPIGNLVRHWAGRMGAPERIDNGDDVVVRIPIEGLYCDLRTPRISRWSDGDQQSRYPGDTGLRYLAGISGRVLYFGTQAPH